MHSGSIDQRIDPRADRGALVDGTREAARRYQESGKPMRAGGVDGRTVAGASIVAGAAVTAGGAAMAPGMLAVATGAAVASGMLMGAGIALASAGIARAVNYAQVDREIKRRQTPLPVDLPRGAQTSVDLFFPVTPQSGRTEVVYVDGHGEHRLHIDTRQARMEADRGSPPELLRRRDPKFPDQARRAGISEGYVKATLEVDSQGRVRRVDVIEAVPLGVFTMEARRTFQAWTYSRGRNNCRIVEATLEFKR